MFSFPGNFKHNFPVLYQSLMTCSQTLHWFWTNIDSEPNAGFAAVSAFTLYQSLMLSWRTQLHSPSTAGCLETVENTDPRKTEGDTWGYPIRPIPQEKLANTETLCRKIIEEIPIPHLDPFIIGHAYLKFIYLKHLCTKWPHM